MLRSIIIDDEQNGINSLKLAISEFTKDVKVVADSDNPRAAIELIQNYKPDIVFLDIHMPELNGFELLEKLVWKNFNLVFVTAHGEHALKALKNNAMDYLLKPIDYIELQAAVNKIKKKIASEGNLFSVEKYVSLFNELDYSQEKGKLLVNLKTAIETVELNDIIYLESNSNYTHIHLSDKKNIVASRNLKEFEKHLAGQHFMRVHHSFIINVRKVVRYLKSEEQIVMINNKQIPLSKNKRDQFYSWLNP